MSKMISILFFLSLSSPSAAAPYNSVSKPDKQRKVWTFKKSENNSVTFAATGSRAVNIEGTGGYIEGTAESGSSGLSAELYVAMDNFDTGNETRNGHMRDKYMETKKYPKVKLTIESLFAVKENEQFNWSGKLTIKNNTKPVFGTATINGGSVKAEFIVNLSDYLEEAPCWLGVCVANQIKVKVKAVGE